MRISLRHTSPFMGTQLLLLLLFPSQFFATVIATSATITPPPRVAGRDLPVESNPAFLGWSHGTDYRYTPSLCNYVDETVTTFSNFVGCCTSGASTCRFATGCTAGDVQQTILGGDSSVFDPCSGGGPGAMGGCRETYIMASYSTMNTESAVYTAFRCKYYYGLSSGSDVLFQNLPPNAEVNTTVSQYTPYGYGSSTSVAAGSSPGSLTAKTTAKDGTTNTQRSKTVNPASDSSNRQSSTTDFSGEFSSPFSASSSPTSGALPASNSDSPGPGLSKSDSIALGVGLGIGIPTIALMVAAWMWPRHRKTPVSPPSESSAPPAPSAPPVPPLAAQPTGWAPVTAPEVETASHQGWLNSNYEYYGQR